jgi:hypothetical protein
MKTLVKVDPCVVKDGNLRKIAHGTDVAAWLNSKPADQVQSNIRTSAHSSYLTWGEVRRTYIENRGTSKVVQDRVVREKKYKVAHKK